MFDVIQLDINTSVVPVNRGLLLQYELVYQYFSDILRMCLYTSWKILYKYGSNHILDNKVMNSLCNGKLACAEHF